MKVVNVSVNLEKMFLIINNAGIKINVDLNVKVFDKGVSDKGFIWNPINCACECDKACDISEDLDYEHCKLVKKLVNECTETVEEVKLARITYAENENCYKCSSCTMYTVLFWIFFTINVGGKGAYFIYFSGYLKRLFTRETTIY